MFGWAYDKRSSIYKQCRLGYIPDDSIKENVDLISGNVSILTIILSLLLVIIIRFSF